ncbi:MAG: response regulator [Chloroflexota bacterium]
MSPRGTILIVDDEPAIADLLAELLGDEGYVAHTALSGERALSMLETLRPDLILLDTYMPVMSGASLFAEIRARPELQHVPIIVMSASAPAAMALQEAGAAAVLIKPFTIETALACVAQVL